MRKISEVLRLKWSLGLSQRAIGRSCGIAHTVVAAASREDCLLLWFHRVSSLGPTPRSVD